MGKSIMLAPDQSCAECGYPLQQADNLDHFRRPKAGDLSLCLNCGAFGVFTSGGGAVRPPSLGEVFHWMVSDLDKFERMEAVAAMIRDRGRFWPRSGGSETSANTSPG